MGATDIILVIEDSDDDWLLFERAVAVSGCSATSRRAISVEEAIECINARLRPRLVFLDLLLPNLRGVHFLRWIRSQVDCVCIPVIVLTV